VRHALRQHGGPCAIRSDDGEFVRDGDLALVPEWFQAVKFSSDGATRGSDATSRSETMSALRATAEWNAAVRAARSHAVALGPTPSRSVPRHRARSHAAALGVNILDTSESLDAASGSRPRQR
jgi:hypothetical protein